MTLLYRDLHSNHGKSFHHLTSRHIIIADYNSYHNGVRWRKLATENGLNLLDIRTVEVWNSDLEKFADRVLIEFMNENDAMIFKLLM